MRFALVQILSLVFPLLTTGVCILGGYGWYQISSYHLPISKILAFAATILPFINLVIARFLISRSYMNTKGSQKINASPLIALSLMLLFCVDVVVLTLASTYYSEPGASCLLQSRWSKYFQQKSLAIKEIQDKLQCCGLRSQNDMPFPFPMKGVNLTRCADMLDSKDFCLPQWASRMKVYAGVLVTAAGVVVLVNLVTLMLAFSKSPKIVRALYYPFSGPQDYFYLMQDHDDDGEGNGDHSRPATGRRIMPYTDDDADAEGDMENEREDGSRGRKLIVNAPDGDNGADDERMRLLSTESPTRREFATTS